MLSFEGKFQMLGDIFDVEKILCSSGAFLCVVEYYRQN